MDSRLKVFIGLITGVVVVGILILFVGIEEFINTLLESNPYLAITAVLCAFLWLLFWSYSFYTVINYSGSGMSYLNSVLTYSSVMFAHNVTPFAHFGGEPLAAEFLSKSTEESYDKCLGALSGVSVIHYIPSIFYFTIGSSYILITHRGIPEPLEILMYGFLGIAIFSATFFLLFKIYENRFINKVLEFLLFVTGIWNKIPYIPVIEESRVKNGVEGYFETLMYVTSNRKVVVYAMSTSVAGVVSQSIGLWVAALAVGVNISIFLPLIAFPIARIASALPLPGGAGGIEAGLITIIVTLSSATVPGATAAVVLIRGSIYWIPVTIGSINVGLIAGSN